MHQTHDFRLTVSAIAEHFALTDRTIRSYLQTGKLGGVRLDGEWRSSWLQVWTAEKAPMPGAENRQAYTLPLLSKQELAGRIAVSERTVERWLAAGLPTRNVFANVRVAPLDATNWLSARFPHNRLGATAFSVLMRSTVSEGASSPG